MKILKVGDVQRAVCNKCSSIESVTFKLRDTPVSDGLGLVKSVLVGVCDKCETIAVIPHQSTPLVKKHIEKKRGAIETRMPAHMIDILNLASEQLSGDIHVVPNLLKYYLYGLSSNQMPAKSILPYLTSDLFSGKADRRLSLKGIAIEEAVLKIKKETSLSCTSDLFRGITLKIKDDIIENKRPAVRSRVENFIAATM